MYIAEDAAESLIRRVSHTSSNNFHVSPESESTPFAVPGKHRHPKFYFDDATTIFAVHFSFISVARSYRGADFCRVLGRGLSLWSQSLFPCQRVFFFPGHVFSAE